MLRIKDVLTSVGSDNSSSAYDSSAYLREDEHALAGYGSLSLEMAVVVTAPRPGKTTINTHIE